MPTLTTFYIVTNLYSQNVTSYHPILNIGLPICGMAFLHLVEVTHYNRYNLQNLHSLYLTICHPLFNIWFTYMWHGFPPLTGLLYYNIFQPFFNVRFIHVAGSFSPYVYLNLIRYTVSTRYMSSHLSWFLVHLFRALPPFILTCIYFQGQDKLIDLEPN